MVEIYGRKPELIFLGNVSSEEFDFQGQKLKNPPHFTMGGFEKNSGINRSTVRTVFKLVDLAEHGTNHPYLVDFIPLTLNIKLLDFEEIRNLFLNPGLSAAQIARKYGVSKTVILSGLHQLGIRVQTHAGRSNNPDNYRLKTPPYGHRIQDGRLVLNKSELRICRLVVELMLRQGLSG